MIISIAALSSFAFDSFLVVDFSENGEISGGNLSSIVEAKNGGFFAFLKSEEVQNDAEEPQIAYFLDGEVVENEYIFSNTSDGILYYIDDTSVGKPYTGLFSDSYYESGKLYSGSEFYLYDSGYIYKVAKNGTAAKYIKNANKAGTYQLEASGKCFTVDNQTASAKAYTGLYSSKYYTKGKLYSGSAFYLYDSGYIYKVAKNGTAAKYIKNASNAGTYQLEASGKCFTVDNQTASAKAYTGMYSSKYYTKGKLYTGSEFYLYDSGYIYKVAKNGTAAKYIKNAKKAGTYQLEASGKCFTVDNQTASAKAYTGLYSSKYYTKGKLYTGSAFYLYDSGYIYKVAKNGTAAKYIKNAKKDGTYKQEIDGKFYEISYKKASAKLYTGWVSASGNKYYTKKGVKQTGWQKISGVYYFFDTAKETKGVLSVNKIVGDYYVDKSGQRVTDAVTALAVKFVSKHSFPTDTPAVRLKACYSYMSKYLTYTRVYGVPNASALPSRAKSALSNLSGNCYSFATAFAYVARVLGYDSGVEIGQVYRDGAWRSHGWCLVKVSGSWYICDPVKQHYGANCYMKTKSNAPIKYSSNGTKHYLSVKNTKGIWS